ncbi:hypothetical protein [Cohnella faecalis]|uniref:Uncharacterized protein n=1 Tax=Cohnella faecalis TaxID=2315694 RepID=A0A398CH27_9BACL|nr:hypothetical protein [Cohnella faecalis]RIE02053.1 hypothetical protein D3H35_14915 [Cohnella faecalis]
MRAVLYAVLTEEGWVPGWSVAWEVDLGYWLEEEFRAGVRSEGTGFAGAGIKGRAMARLKEPIPLGLAEAASDWLAERFEVHGRKRDKSQKGIRDGSLEGLRKEERRSLEENGDRAYSENVEELLQEALRAAYFAESGGSAGLTTERSSSKADVFGNLSMAMETMLCSAGGNGSREGMFEEGRTLAKFARMASERLQGRSLLQEEAAPLLAQALPAGGGFAAAKRALQLAALLGAVRLTAAVAPQPLQAPGRGRCDAPSARFSPARLAAAGPCLCAAAVAAAAQRSCGAHGAPLAGGDALTAKRALRWGGAANAGCS